MVVHSNLLTGKLLVNGLPMARLSSDYESHRAYESLFGKSQLDVMPSDLQGMRFSVRKRHMDHVVHLGQKAIPSSKKWDLLVEAVKGNETWSFVSPRIFVSAFPNAFSEDYAHWYNSNRGCVEFRPINNPWESSISNWTLRKDQSNGSWCLERDEACLINPSSSTAKSISQLFAPVEMPAKFHCYMNRASSALEIDLPRLRLKFALSPGSSVIRSWQYPGMSVDANQSLGSLIGLRDKLVLVHAKTGHRMILVPEGKVTCDRKNEHVEIKVKWQARTNVHSFSIDDELGRIIDNGSIQSKLLLAYLHALTSFCLPDPLTKRTGTEQALSILRSASLRSFDKLQPERSYYPRDKEVMQSVKWSFSLNSLSQHSSFYEEAMAILRQHDEMGVFYPEMKLQNVYSLPNNDKLLKRDLMRSASFRISGFGAEDHHRLTCSDREYTGRSSTSGIGFESRRIHSLCKMVYDGIPRIRHITPSEMVLQIWRFLSKSDRIDRPAAHMDPASLKYDAELFLRPREFLASNWCSINRLIFSSSRPNKFQFMIWLSTMALSEQVDMTAIEFLASLYTVPELGSTPLPDRISFFTGQGYQVDRKALRNNLHLLPISKTPEASLTRNLHESDRAYDERKHRSFKSNKLIISKKMVSHFEGQWPTRSPLEPSCKATPKLSDYVDMERTMASMKRQFAVWYDNKELRQYHFDIATLLTAHDIHPVLSPSYCHIQKVECPLRRPAFVSFHDLLKRPPPVKKLERPHIDNILRPDPTTETSISQLVEMTGWLGIQARTPYEKWCSEQLRDSIKSLQEVRPRASIDLNAIELQKVAENYLSRCEEYARVIEDIITSHLKNDRGETERPDSKEAIEAKVLAVLFNINQCPRLSASLILEQLTRHRTIGFSAKFSEWPSRKPLID